MMEARREGVLWSREVGLRPRFSFRCTGLGLSIPTPCLAGPACPHLRPAGSVPHSRRKGP